MGVPHGTVQEFSGKLLWWQLKQLGNDGQ